MTSASLDRLLAVLVVALAATGLVSLRAGAPDQGWIFVAHGVLAGALLVAVAMKLRSSVPRAVGRRRWVRLGLGLAVSLAAAGALAGGYAWVVSGEIVWLDVAGLVRWTVLTVHAWIGLVLVPLVLVHLLPLRWRLLRPGRRAVTEGAGRLLSRRSLLAGGALLGTGVVLSGLATLVDTARGGTRRFTGSRWLPPGGIPPPTTFFGEPPPALDPGSWRLRVGPRRLALEDLRALGQTESTAVLDCTSGWAIETTWQGISLDAVLDAGGLPHDRPILVRSATGWSTVLEPDEARVAVLAWGCAGAPLGIGNGAPLRLVVPDRRGLDWVKWVTEVGLA